MEMLKLTFSFTDQMTKDVSDIPNNKKSAARVCNVEFMQSEMTV